MGTSTSRKGGGKDNNSRRLPLNQPNPPREAGSKPEVEAEAAVQRGYEPQNSTVLAENPLEGRGKAEGGKPRECASEFRPGSYTWAR